MAELLSLVFSNSPRGVSIKHLWCSLLSTESAPCALVVLQTIKTEESEAPDRNQGLPMFLACSSLISWFQGICEIIMWLGYCYCKKGRDLILPGSLDKRDNYPCYKSCKGSKMDEVLLPAFPLVQPGKPRELQAPRGCCSCRECQEWKVLHWTKAAVWLSFVLTSDSRNSKQKWYYFWFSSSLRSFLFPWQ